MRQRRNVMIGAMVAAMAFTGASAAPPDTVSFCHATASETNPYTSNTTSIRAFFNSGHNDHGGDIVPPFEQEDGTVFSLNWDEAGQAIFANGCTPVTATVTPEPDETPTVTPEPDETPVVTPEPDETPAVTPEPDETPAVTPEPDETPVVTPTVPAAPQANESVPTQVPVQAEVVPAVEDVQERATDAQSVSVAQVAALPVSGTGSTVVQIAGWYLAASVSFTVLVIAVGIRIATIRGRRSWKEVVRL